MNRSFFNAKVRPLSRKSLQRGQATVEYAAVCVVLALALGISLLDERSVLWQLLEAFKTAYQRLSFALSLPW